MTPYHERLTVRLREAAEEYRHGQHTGASDQRLVLSQVREVLSQFPAVRS